MNNIDYDTRKAIIKIVESRLHIKEHLEHIDKIERNYEDNGYIVTYTSHESDDGWQYSSEQNTMLIEDEYVHNKNNKLISRKGKL